MHIVGTNSDTENDPNPSVSQKRNIFSFTAHVWVQPVFTHPGDTKKSYR